MKTWLTLNGSTRSETSAETIATLKRKGWTEIADPTPPPAPPDPVVVTMRSFRLALGRTRYIELMAFIGAIPDAEQKFQAQTFIEYSLTVVRDHPMVLQFAAALNKSDAEVDAVFAAAKQLDLTA